MRDVLSAEALGSSDKLDQSHFSDYMIRNFRNRKIKYKNVWLITRQKYNRIFGLQADSQTKELAQSNSIAHSVHSSSSSSKEIFMTHLINHRASYVHMIEILLLLFPCSCRLQ